MPALQGLFACWCFQCSHVKPFYHCYPARWRRWAESRGVSWILRCLRSSLADCEARAGPGVGEDSCKGGGGSGH